MSHLCQEWIARATFNACRIEYALRRCCILSRAQGTSQACVLLLHGAMVPSLKGFQVHVGSGYAQLLQLNHVSNSRVTFLAHATKPTMRRRGFLLRVPRNPLHGKAPCSR